MFRKVALRLARRKVYNVNDDGEIMENHHGTGPKLSRILNLFDLTLLGVGSTLGVGIYVLAGSVSRDIAGPAVCLSFLVAAAASAISGFTFKIINHKIKNYFTYYFPQQLPVMLNLGPESLVPEVHMFIVMLQLVN